MSATYRDLNFPSADGRLSLYARDYAGDGPALLLMHGLTRNSADFEGLADHLAGRYRLVVPDQRGRGRSEWDPDPSCYAVDRYCADMLGLIQHLELDRPVLLGTSMGGLMAIAMASIAPQNYRAIVLNDAGPEVEAEGLARIASYVGRPVNVADWTAAADHCRKINGSTFPHYGEQEWLSFARRVFTPEPDGGLTLNYDLAIAVPLSAPQSPAPDLWPLWRQLAGVPMLMIRGELSDLLTAQTVAKMQDAHRDMQVCTVPGVGHAPMLDEPVAIAAIERFLRGLDQTR